MKVLQEIRSCIVTQFSLFSPQPSKSGQTSVARRAPTPCLPIDHSQGGGSGVRVLGVFTLEIHHTTTQPNQPATEKPSTWVLCVIPSLLYIYIYQR